MDEDIKKQIKSFVFMLVVGTIVIYLLFILNSDKKETNMIDYSIPESVRYIQSPQITWNDVALFDSTIYNNATNTCNGQRYGMNITISPCIAMDIDGKDIKQDVIFDWNGEQQRNITWIFVYDNQIENGNINALVNHSKTFTETINENKWVNNYLVDGVVSYTNYSTPPEFCDLGNLNNTQFYNVTRNKGNSTFQQNICFTSRTVVNATAFRISGNADISHEVQVTRYVEEYIDVTDRVEFLGKGLLNDNRSYYRIQDVKFNPNQKIETQWIYTPKDKTKFGKWHILGFESEVGLVQSVVQDKYIYIDPWWSTSWTLRKQINITGVIPTNYSVRLEIKNESGMNITYADLRFTDINGNELPHYLETSNTTSATIWVKIQDNNSIYLYYNNPLALSSSNIQGTFVLGDDFNTFNSTTWACQGTQATYCPVANGYITAKRLEDSKAVFNSTMQFTNGYGFFAYIDFINYPSANQKGIGFDCAGVCAPWGETQKLSFNYGNGGGVNSTYLMGNANQILSTHQRFGTFQRFSTNVNASGSPRTYLNITLVNNTITKDNTAKPIGTFISNGGGDLKVDRIAVYKYIYPYPTITFGGEETSTGIVITLNNPDNDYRVNISNFNFNFTIQPQALNVTNWTFTIWHENHSIARQYQNLTVNTNITFNVTRDELALIDDHYIWGVYSCGTNGINQMCDSSVNRTFRVDTIAPYFIINNISNQSTITIPINITYNVTTEEIHGGDCWFNTSDSATIQNYSCNAVQTILFNSGGTKTIYVYANDSFGNHNMTSYQFNIYDFNVTQSENADPIAEGSLSQIYLRINSTSFPITDASANIIWNGTDYSATSKNVIDTRTILFAYAFPVIAGMGNATGISYSYNWTYNTTQLSTRQTPTATQTIISFDIDDCSVYGVQIANFSLKDEELNQYLYTVNTTGTKLEIETLTTSATYPDVTWSYSNLWTNVTSVTLCIPTGVLDNSNFTIDITAGFEGTGHVREFWFLDNGTLAKNQYPFNSYTSVNVSLMDLLTTDSTTFLFEFTDSDGLEVPDAIVHVYRKYIGEGVFREVERSRQDNNGQTHVHLVEEDVIYYFVITEDGEIIYTSDTYNAKCLSSPCEITLSATPDTTNWSVIDNQGGLYAVTSNKNNRIVTTTFKLDSIELVNVSLYEVKDGVHSLVNTSSLTATAGSIPLHVPLAYGNKTYFVAIWKDNKFVRSKWIDMTESGKDYFRTTGAIFGGLIVVTIMLMAITEGVGFIIFTCFALIIIGVMQLVELSWLSIISIICAGGIIIFKLVKRRTIA